MTRDPWVQEYLGRPFDPPVVGESIQVPIRWAAAPGRAQVLETTPGEVLEIAEEGGVLVRYFDRGRERTKWLGRSPRSRE